MTEWLRVWSEQFLVSHPWRVEDNGERKRLSIAYWIRDSWSIWKNVFVGAGKWWDLERG